MGTNKGVFTQQVFKDFDGSGNEQHLATQQVNGGIINLSTKHDDFFEKYLFSTSDEMQLIIGDVAKMGCWLTH